MCPIVRASLKMTTLVFDRAGGRAGVSEVARQIELGRRTCTLQAKKGELDAWNAAVNLQMTSAQFAVHIGLTPNVFWKRVQAARVLRCCPRARARLVAGATQVTHLALVAARITAANAELLLTGIKGKSRREVEGLLSRVTSDGRLLDQDEEVELRIELSSSQLKALDRAREVLSHSGHVPSLAEIVMKALGDLLEKRDPVRLAAKAQERQAKAGRKAKAGGADVDVGPSPAKDEGAL